MYNNDKKAVVLAGGGARGSYEIGVWKALKEVGYDYKIVTGSSVGTLNGALMVMGEIDKAIEIWEIIETERILDYDISGNVNTAQGLLGVLTDFVGRAVKNKGISAAPLRKLVNEYINEQQMRDSGIEFGITVTKLNGFKGQEIFLKDIQQYGKVKDYIMGSSSFYPIMQSWIIDDEEYIDGGYYNNIPISMALEAGATEIVAVDLKSVGLVRKAKVPDNVKVTTITTSWDLGALLMFNPHRSIRNIQLGYLDGLKAFGLLEGIKYAFEKGQLDFKKNEIESKLKVLLERMKINLFYFSSNASDALIKSSILRILNKDTKSDININDMILFGAETMGEMFDVSPLEIYSFSNFDKELDFQLNFPEEHEVNDQIASSEKELLDYLLGSIVAKGRMSLFMGLYKIMNKDLYTDGDINILNIAANVSTTEFLAALYGISSDITIIEE